MNRYQALVEAEFDAFIADATVPDREARVPAATLYDSYVTWSESRPSPVPPMTNTYFGLHGGRKLLRNRTKAGQVYLGIRLK